MRATKRRNMILISILSWYSSLNRVRICLLMIGGRMKIAAYPPMIKNARALMMGINTLRTVISPTRASNCERTTRAIISSITAAEIINWPTGVLRTPPFRRILRAIPSDVGPKTAPAARIPLVSVIFSIHVINIPIPIGKILPKKAIKNPRVPISLSVLRSISIPASITNRTRPSSPNMTQASGFGTKSSSRGGPSRIPQKISPTRLGMRRTRLAISPLT
mmetsp:Transcript_85002/g.245810  ORF Transcript_85002/g.245810 Transcript_85002/m.245810 type:complete len:220 (+) Transcript_85002:68-727(+)